MGQQAQLARQQLAAQISQHQAEQQTRDQQTKIEQQRADQAEQQLENEHEFHSKTLEQQHAMNQAQMELHKMTALKGIRDSIYEGMNPAALTNKGSPGTPNAPGIIAGVPGGTMGGTPDTRALNLPGLGINIPLNQMPTQQSLLNTEATQRGALAKAQSAGSEEGALPYKQILANEEFAHKKDLQDNENDFRARQQTNELASHEKIAQWDRGTQFALGKMRNDTELQGLNMRYNLSPADTEAAGAAIFTGQVKPNFDNPIDRRLITAGQNQGFRILPEKDAEALRNSQGMNPVLDKLENWVNKLPDEQKQGPVSAVTNALGLKGILGTGLSTDMKNELNQIKSDGFTVARNVDNVTQGRIPMQEMNQVLDSFANVTTKQQGKDNLKYLRDKWNNRIGSNLEGGMPQAQQNMIYHTYKIPPPWLTQQIEMDKQDPKGNQSKGLQPDIDASVGKGQLVYTRPQ